MVNLVISILIKNNTNIMKLLLKRIYTCKDYTIGHLYIKDQYICDTLEDTDRMLDDSMPMEQILNIKVRDKTAIPTGTYNILMNIISPKYSKKQYYMDVCGGKVPRIDNVPGFSGILIHCGNSAADTSGCLLLGYNKVKGKVLQSKSAFEKLYPILKAAYKRNESISITIIRTY